MVFPMHSLKFLLTIAFLFTFNSVVLAQESSLIKIGENSDELPIFLDTDSIRDTNFEAIQKTVEGYMLVTSLHGDCGSEKSIVQTNKYYDSNGQKIYEEQGTDVYDYNPNTPVGRALKYVCRSVHARGW